MATPSSTTERRNMSGDMRPASRPPQAPPSAALSASSEHHRPIQARARCQPDCSRRDSPPAPAIASAHSGGRVRRHTRCRAPRAASRSCQRQSIRHISRPPRSAARTNTASPLASRERCWWRHRQRHCAQSAPPAWSAPAPAVRAGRRRAGSATARRVRRRVRRCAAAVRRRASRLMQPWPAAATGASAVRAAPAAGRAQRRDNPDTAPRCW